MRPYRVRYSTGAGNQVKHTIEALPTHTDLHLPMFARKMSVEFELNLLVLISPTATETMYGNTGKTR